MKLKMALVTSVLAVVVVVAVVATAILGTINDSNE